jgi:Lipid A 3-O-deacylase (PagL)
MFRPATVPLWKALLVLLTVGLPLHAQSAPSTFSDEVDVKPIATWDGLRPQMADCDMWSSSERQTSRIDDNQSAVMGLNDDVGGASKSPPAAVIRPNTEPNLDRGPYYRNKLEFAFDGGWLPINIPFVFDIFMGDAYNMTPLRYTLVPLVASLRWHIDDVGGPWIFRGNWDMTASGSITIIPRGPETRYFSYDMGVRRNFVPRRGKVAPYFDGRLGLGQIDAKEPLGVSFAQGQNFTFTVNLGAGARYNFSPRYSISAGLNWMHISNLYLSEPAFSNYGINVYGPMFGIDIRLGKPRHGSR